MHATVSYSTYTFAVLLCASASSVHSQSISQVNTLSSALMNGYNANTRPVANQTDTLKVDLVMIFARIREFEEVEGKLSTASAMTLTWKDCSLTWNASEHGNVKSLTMSEKSVWTPYLFITNAFGKMAEFGDYDKGTVKYTSNGVARWQIGADVQTICNIDTTYFPLDVQTCKINIGFKGYTSEEIEPAFKLDTHRYEKHGTWKLLKTSSSCLDSNYLCFLTIQLERQPEFIILNLLVPILTLVFLNPLVFLLPVESGERIGFAITNLLALSVFMTILGDYLPRSSNTTTLLSIMLILMFAQSAFILILVITSLRMYHSTDGTPIPAPYRWLVTWSKWSCFHRNKVCCETRREQPTIKDSREIDHEGHVTQDYVSNPDEAFKLGGKKEGKHDPYRYNYQLGGKREREHDQYYQPNDPKQCNEHAKLAITWRDVSMVADKLYVYMTYTVDIVIVVTFLVYIRVNGQTSSTIA